MIIGLTGGIATGKSTVAEMLRGLGARIIDADELARRAVQKGTSGYGKVVALFGAEILGDDGEIDRKRLGALVFKDSSLRRRLEEIIHPEVFREFEAESNVIAAGQPDAIIVFNAALLIETGYHERMDLIVVVYASDEDQLDRLVRRDSLTPGEALERIGSQLSLEIKKGLAHHLINNSGSVDDTRRQVEALYRRLSGEAKGLPVDPHIS